MERAVKEICFAANVLDPNIILILFGLVFLGLGVIFLRIYGLASDLQLVASKIESIDNNFRMFLLKNTK